MMKRFVVIMLLIISICPVCFAVQDFKKIDLNEAINIATKNNIDLEISKMGIDIAKNNIKIANRLQNPNFDTFYNFGKAGKGNPQQLGISETFEVAKRSVRKKLAKSNLELTKDNVKYVEFNLKMDVRKAYTELMAAKSVLNCLEEQQKLLEELLHVAEKRVEYGAAPEMEAIQAKIALNQLITQVNTARVNVKTEIFEFNKLLNPKDDVKVTFDSKDEIFNSFGEYLDIKTPDLKIELPSFDDIAEKTLDRRFDIIIAKQELDVAQKNLIVIARQRIPDIAIQGGYGYQNKSQSEVGSFLHGGYVGASIVNLPLFYNYTPEIKNAKMEIEQSRLKLTATYNKARNDLKSAYEKFVNTQLNLNYYNDKLLKDSDELMQISKRSYEVGKSNLTSLIVMEQSYKSIVVGYTYALADYYSCWIDFLREINVEEFKVNEESI